MAALDNRSDRYWWGIGNLALATFCIPICYGLPSKDFASLKFASAIAGTALALNSVRLLSEHSESAGIRTAWRTSQEMVSGAWIEQMAIANLPPNYQQPVYSNSGSKNYYLPAQPPQLNFPIAKQSQDETPPERGSDRKMPNLSAYNAVLIYGVPGTGKTTFAEREVQKRLNLGHEVIVLDPHAAYGAWKGCAIIGGGMDYGAIDAKLKWLFNEIKNRYYLKTQSEPNPHLPPLTVVAEEFTQWSKKVKNASELFWAANTDIRKVEIFVLFVNHTRTLVACGGAKGAGELRDDNLLEIQLQGEMNEQTGRATPLFQALVKMPGKALSERYLVAIDKNLDRVPAVSAGTPRSVRQEGSKNFGTPYGTRAERFSAMLAEILTETSPAVFSAEFPLEHGDRLDFAKLVIGQNLGVEKTILALWGVRRGGRNHHLYVEAKAMLDRLIAEIG